jgi:hypothetical protein
VRHLWDSARSARGLLAAGHDGRRLRQRSAASRPESGLHHRAAASWDGDGWRSCLEEETRRETRGQWLCNGRTAARLHNGQVSGPGRSLGGRTTGTPRGVGEKMADHCECSAVWRSYKIYMPPDCALGAGATCDGSLNDGRFDAQVLRRAFPPGRRACPAPAPPRRTTSQLPLASAASFTAQVIITHLPSTPHLQTSETTSRNSPPSRPPYPFALCLRHGDAAALSPRRDQVYPRPG